MNESSLLDFAWSTGVLQLTPMSINLVAHVLRHPKDNKKFLATNTGQSVGPWMFRYKTTRRSLSISSRKNTFRNYPQLNKWILSLPSLPPPIPSPPTSRTLRTLGVIASSLECVSLRAFFPVILFVGRYTPHIVFGFIIIDFDFFCTELASGSYPSWNQYPIPL